MRFLKKNNNPDLTLDYFKSKVSKKVFADWQAKGGEIGQFSYGGIKVHQLKTALQKGIIFKIGSFCSIAKGVELNLCNNHDVDAISTYPFEMIFTENWPESAKIQKNYHSKGNIEIGSDVWIGNDVKILSGVKIGHGAVVALGAVVTKDIPPYEIWGGVPARKIKDRFSEDDKKLLLESQWWNLPIQEISKIASLLIDNNIVEFDNAIKEIKSRVDVR
jgi:acetyltransferase-like isoleucine patch superfamily enzyme